MNAYGRDMDISPTGIRSISDLALKDEYNIVEAAALIADVNLYTLRYECGIVGGIKTQRISHFPDTSEEEKGKVMLAYEIFDLLRHSILY